MIFGKPKPLGLGDFSLGTPEANINIIAIIQCRAACVVHSDTPQSLSLSPTYIVKDKAHLPLVLLSNPVQLLAAHKAIIWEASVNRKKKKKSALIGKARNPGRKCTCVQRSTPQILAVFKEKKWGWENLSVSPRQEAVLHPSPLSADWLTLQMLSCLQDLLQYC